MQAAEKMPFLAAVEVRLAQEEDIPAIWEITQEAFLKYADALGSRGKVKALLETQQDILLDMQKKVVLIGLVGGKPMGSIRLEAMEDVAYISRFGVRTSAQGQGVGRALLAEVEKLCRQRGDIAAIALHTSSRMAGLIRFYYGQGFFVHSTGTDRGYIRALLVREIKEGGADLSPVMEK